MLLEDDPEVTKQITATHTYFMPLSDPLYSFMGFFEKDFRVHDFYLGMHSAHRWFSEVVQSWRADAHPRYPEEVYAHGRDDAEQELGPLPLHACRFDGAGSRRNLQRGRRARCARASRPRSTASTRAARELAHSSTRRRDGPADDARALPPRVPGRAPALLPGMRDTETSSSERKSPLWITSCVGWPRTAFAFATWAFPEDVPAEAKRYIAQRIGHMVRALANRQERGMQRAVLPVRAASCRSRWPTCLPTRPGTVDGDADSRAAISGARSGRQFQVAAGHALARARWAVGAGQPTRSPTRSS